jgi:glutamyl-tRNA synthetase
MANVVDDHLMAISHVLRGDEWIASTPRHVLLYEAFGWEAPVFAHLPVILSPDGGKLSKRKGAASVMDYKNAGYLPEALFNFLAFLGWAPGDDREKMSREELIKAFSLEQVSPKASVLDEKKAGMDERALHGRERFTFSCRRSTPCMEREGVSIIRKDLR